jgi:F0F1-type ATP synthase epsilon subunit
LANAIPFQLITPLSVKFDGEAELVIAVGTEGEVGILPSHAPYLTALRPGVRARRRGRRDAPPGARMQRRLHAGAPGQGDDPRRRRARPRRDRHRTSTARTSLQRKTNKTSAGGDLTAQRRAQTKIDFANARLHVAGVN